MKFIYRKNSRLAAWLALILLLAFGSARADDDDIERMAIFGDSLSDAGNVYALTGLTSQPPYDIIPSAPYDFQGFVFSNGRTWAQHFASRLDIGRYGKASLVKPGKFGNYAFGGARARPDSGAPSPSGPDQLNMYLADFNGAADDETLYVIQLGGNDVRDALEVLMKDPTDFLGAAAIVMAAIEAEAGMIATLHERGARRFLVADVPNLALAPAVKLAGPEAVFAASTLVAMYNSGLESTLQGLELVLPGITIDRLSFFDALNDIAANPDKFGIDNAESPCLMFFVIEGAVCKKPNKYLFWDGIHPTKKTHRIVGKIAAEMYDD